MPKEDAFVTTGTTDLFHIPGGSTTTVIPGKSYFLIRVKSAQAAFHGHIWQRAQQLIVTSQVGLNLSAHPTLAEPVQGIQHSRQIRRNRAEKLGLNPNLINLVPAKMTHISISIDFLLDVRNSLNTLGALINDETFVSVISMAPGAAIVARTISSLSNKIIQAFMEPEERKPILQFHGDLNIASREVQEGYYVILGTCDKSSPIPRPLPRLEVQNGDLLADGNAVTQWSYVIFEVRVLPARTRDLNDGAEWDLRIREAEDEALVVAHDPLADAEQRRLAWDSVSELLKEAQVLLRADPNYLREEASKIIKKVYVDCYQQIFDTYPSSVVTSLGPVRGKGSISLARPDSAGRRYLGIPEDEDLSAIVNRYKTEVMESRQIIASEKIQ